MQAAVLDSETSKLLLLTLTGRGLVNLVNFRDFLKVFSVVYLLV